jgi:hypothetical protein
LKGCTQTGRPDWANFSFFGRIFRLLGDCLLWGNGLKSTEIAQFFGLAFPRHQLCVNFDKEMGRAAFWATLSQTHLVSLQPDVICGGSKTFAQKTPLSNVTKSEQKIILRSPGAEAPALTLKNAPGLGGVVWSPPAIEET